MKKKLVFIVVTILVVFLTCVTLPGSDALWTGNWDAFFRSCGETIAKISAGKLMIMVIGGLIVYAISRLDRH